MATNVFEDELAINIARPNEYTAKVGNSQRIGEFLHGGFAASLVVFTALEHLRLSLSRRAQHHVVAFHVEFMKLVDRAEICLVVEHLSIGRTMVKLRVNLRQNETLKVFGDVTLVDAASSNSGISPDTEYYLSPPPTPVDLSKLGQYTDRNWVLARLPYNHKRQNMNGSHWNLGVMVSGPVHPRIHDMWCTLVDPNARITTLALPVLADFYLRMADNYVSGGNFSYVACVERAKRAINGVVREEDLDNATIVTWTATQSLSLEIVRQLPPEGVKWIFVRAEAKSIRNGRHIAELTMLNECLEIVAIGRITDLLVPAAKRQGFASKSDARVVKI